MAVPPAGQLRREFRPPVVLDPDEVEHLPVDAQRIRGEIIEQGTHDTLIARRGAYYELYRRQSVERQVESMGPAERRL